MKCEVYLLVDADGDWVCAESEKAARAAYMCRWNIDYASGMRIIKLLVEVPLPVVVTLKAVAAPQGAAVMTIAD